MLVLKKVGLISLGCAKNQVDSEVMLGHLKSHNYQLTEDKYQADALIVNTCGFIEDAKEESIDAILQAARYKEVGECEVVIVCGCLSQRYKSILKEEMPEIDILLGTDQWDKIGETLDKAFAGKEVQDDFSRKADMYSHDAPRLPIDYSEYKGSAYIKIAEGCDNHCSFCAIPLIRGGFRSRSIDSIKKEATKLASAGVKEINLIAQDTTRYGLDIYDEYKLSDLLEELTTIPEITWIRFLYGHPSKIDDKLINIISTKDKICPYVDLPLQHINEKVLQRMNRNGSKSEIKQLLQKLRANIPDVVIRTSFMVGFPGETEEEFNELLDFIQEMKFDQAGIFKYSKEENTKAYEYEDEVDEEEKEIRYIKATKLQQQIMKEKRSKWIGKTFKVLIDEELEDEPGTYLGRTKYQAPEVDGSVIIPDSSLDEGNFVNVKITQILENDLIGEIDYEFSK